ncbi:MAG: GntR family transcriptional regulator [Planctomycetota bacterium]|nr:GntR family transcriptional regulator [Planctomycetota bacterium]
MNPVRRRKSRPSPKQHALASELRRAIITGTLAPGARVPTRAELVSQNGLSLITVQRALERLERDGFVESRGSLGTFVARFPPHRFRYGLAFVNPSNVVALSNYWSTLAQHADSMASAEPRRVHTYFDVDAHADNESFRLLRSDLAARRVAGLVFTSTPRLLEGTSALHLPDLPRVVLGNEPFHDCAVLSLDYDSMVQQAMDLFAAQGRRRIAAITVSNVLEAGIQAIMHSAQKRGMECKTAWIHGIDHLHPMWAGNSARLLMSLPPAERPDGLLILDDNLVEHATAGVIDMGVRVPDQLGVVAHCNFPRITTSLVPSSRVGFDARQVLVTAMDLIDRMQMGLETPEQTWIAAAVAPQFAPRAQVARLA